MAAIRTCEVAPQHDLHGGSERNHLEAEAPEHALPRCHVVLESLAVRGLVGDPVVEVTVGGASREALPGVGDERGGGACVQCAGVVEAGVSG